MSIEANLERIAKALETLAGYAIQQTQLPDASAAAGVKQPDPEPPAGTSEVTTQPEPVKNEAAPITHEDIVEVMKEIIKAGHREKAGDVLAQYGADKVGDVSPDLFPSLMTDLKKIDLTGA